MSAIGFPTIWVPERLRPVVRRRSPWWRRFTAPLLNPLIQWKGDHILWSGGHIAHSSTCCCSSGAPCACAWPTGLNAVYTVAGTASIGTCPLCDPDTTDPAWDGTFNHIGGACVWWAADASFDPLSINGVMLDFTYTQILLKTTVPCRWEMYIACGSNTNPTQTMWRGIKTTGSTPAGTYTFQGSDCGNTGPATLNVT